MRRWYGKEGRGFYHDILRCGFFRYLCSILFAHSVYFFALSCVSL